MGSRAESPEEIKRRSAEHSALARKQYEALQKSPYFQMSDSEANANDERRKRIGVICERLAEFRSKAYRVIQATSISNRPGMLSEDVLKFTRSLSQSKAQ